MKEFCSLTLSRRRSVPYRNQSIHFLCKSMDWFLYDKDLRHESIKRARKSNKQTDMLQELGKTIFLQFEQFIYIRILFLGLDSLI